MSTSDDEEGQEARMKCPFGCVNETHPEGTYKDRRSLRKHLYRLHRCWVCLAYHWSQGEMDRCSESDKKWREEFKTKFEEARARNSSSSSSSSFSGRKRSRSRSPRRRRRSPSTPRAHYKASRSRSRSRTPPRRRSPQPYPSVPQQYRGERVFVTTNINFNFSPAAPPPPAPPAVNVMDRQALPWTRLLGVENQDELVIPFDVDNPQVALKKLSEWNRHVLFKYREPEYTGISEWNGHFVDLKSLYESELNNHSVRYYGGFDLSKSKWTLPMVSSALLRMLAHKCIPVRSLEARNNPT